ncbi:hypothetical protein HD554DRAFT_2176554 [Boletus coccyginus]|nr:hypothetical protein HD554DRAFT_2176554 [Boletus coccyginus]
MPGGLHPTYIIFNESPKPKNRLLKRSELVEANLANIFDVICKIASTGGISVLLRCPGGNTLNLHSKKITITLYVTPQELIQNIHLKW